VARYGWIRDRYEKLEDKYGRLRNGREEEGMKV
jgi:hypothetical protein